MTGIIGARRRMPMPVAGSNTSIMSRPVTAVGSDAHEKLIAQRNQMLANRQNARNQIAAATGARPDRITTGMQPRRGAFAAVGRRPARTIAGG